MRKTTKMITEVTHEHGVVSFELPAYEKLLSLAAMDGVRKEHRDLMVEKTMKIAAEIGGEPLSVHHIPAIVAGTPAVAAAMTA